MDGVSHERWNVVLFLASSPALLQLGLGPLEVGGYLLGGAVGTFLLSPDIDLEDSRPSKRWGPLKVLWSPYRALHPHRGSSHSYVYGPLSRLGYLGFLLAPLWTATKNTPFGQEVLASVDRGEALAFLLWAGVGYLFSQWLHLLQDGIPPFGRRGRFLL